MFVVDNITLDTHKTKNLVSLLKNSYQTHKPYIIHDESEIDNNMKLAIRNVQWIDIVPDYGCNVYDVINHHEVIITKKALKNITTRLLKTNAIKYVAPSLDELISSGQIKTVSN